MGVPWLSRSCRYLLLIGRAGAYSYSHGLLLLLVLSLSTDDSEALASELALISGLLLANVSSVRARQTRLLIPPRILLKSTRRPKFDMLRLSKSERGSFPKPIFLFFDVQC